jgi:Domain of unknown function (DUF4258)
VSETFERVKKLIVDGNYSFSDHAYEEMTKDDILPHELTYGALNSILVEDYPNAHRGPTALIYCVGHNGRPLHAVWGIPKLNTNMVVLVTAYRPDSDEWSKDFLRRLKS